MKLAYLLLVVLVGSSICASNSDCVAALNAIVPALKTLKQANDAKNEATFLSALKSEGVAFNKAIVVCDGVSSSKSFKDYVTSVDKNTPACLNSLLDAAFLGAIIRNQSIEKDWDAYFIGLADFTNKVRNTFKPALCQF